MSQLEEQSSGHNQQRRRPRAKRRPRQRQSPESATRGSHHAANPHRAESEPEVAEALPDNPSLPLAGPAAFLTRFANAAAHDRILMYIFAIAFLLMAAAKLMGAV
jgi:hypothetical protein